MKRRYGYLDFLKIVAMMCVCLYHYPMIRHTGYIRPFPLETLILRYFRLFDVVCVPLFMMVNGALLLNRPFNAKKHAVRCAALFVGVYVWYMITMVCGHAWQNGFDYVRQNFSAMLMSAQYLYEFGGIGTSHLWFAQMLVAVYLVVPLIHAAMNSRDAQIQKGLALFVLGIGLFAFLLQDISHVRAAVPVLRRLDLSGLGVNNPFRNAYGAMIVYFVLGGLLHRMHECMLRVPLWACVLAILGGSVVLFCEWYLVTIRTEAMYDIVYGGYSCLPTVMMTMGMFVLAAKAEEKLRLSEGKLGGVIGLVGRNTLAVYYLHWIMGLTVLTLMPALPGCFAVNLIKAAAMVLLCSFLGEGLRRVPVLRRLV